MSRDKYQSIINCDVLQLIENYAQEHDGFSLKLIGFSSEISVSAYSFPSSFNYDQARSQLKKLKYKDSLHLLNATYHKLGIRKLSKADLKNCVVGESEYWYLHINFDTPIPPELQKHYKSQTHNFMVFLTDRETDEGKGFRLMYSSNSFFNYTEEFDKAIYLELDEIGAIENEDCKIAILQLESVIYGICKTVGIEISQDLRSETLDRLILQPPKIATFRTLLKLLTRGHLNDSEYQKEAKKLQTFHKKGVNEYKIHEKIRDILERYYMTYYSDWKFDPENIEYAISEILDEEFTFEYPEDTYSHELFKYIQSELAKRELTLMNIETFGDSYLFVVANTSDVDLILETSQTIDLKVEKV
jgi:hypothetical protein